MQASLCPAMGSICGRGMSRGDDGRNDEAAADTKPETTRRHSSASAAYGDGHADGGVRRSSPAMSVLPSHPPKMCPVSHAGAVSAEYVLDIQPPAPCRGMRSRAYKAHRHSSPQHRPQSRSESCSARRVVRLQPSRHCLPHPLVSGLSIAIEVASTPRATGGRGRGELRGHSLAMSHAASLPFVSVVLVSCLARRVFVHGLRRGWFVFALQPSAPHPLQNSMEHQLSHCPPEHIPTPVPLIAATSFIPCHWPMALQCHAGSARGRALGIWQRLPHPRFASRAL